MEDGAAARREPKNIVLFSDGTGNSAGKLFRTNVWRLYTNLDLSNPEKQIAFYDDGVGTSSFRPLALLGGIFGVGLRRNVLDLYKFLCRNYEPGDRIFVFGFSRGAFTARVVTALVVNQGVLTCKTEEDRALYARDAYRAYRKRYNQTGGLVGPLRALRDKVVSWRRRRSGHAPYSPAMTQEVPAIAFVGVWDTVAAYGMPIAELTRGIDDWIWPLSMPNYQLSTKVLQARHALALDDERDTFRPLLWDETKETNDRLRQVWFAGVHSDVGGGYPQDSLSYVSLDWMMTEAAANGLLLKPGVQAEVRRLMDPDGVKHDSRRGLAAYYRYQPRKIASWLGSIDPTTRIMRDPRPSQSAQLKEVYVHDSVLRRIESGTDGYAPIVLPASFTVVSTKSPASLTGSPRVISDRVRADRQEWVWNEVWRRRVGYFGTVGISLLLLFLPVWQQFVPPSACNGPQCLAATPIAAAATVLPSFFAPWLDAFSRAPGFVLLALAAIAFLMARSGRLQCRIGDGMRELWKQSLQIEPREAAVTPAGKSSRDPTGHWIWKLRSKDFYQESLRALKWKWLPGFFGVAGLVLLLAFGLYVAFVLASRTTFAVSNYVGAICTAIPTAARADGQSQPAAIFQTRNVCWPTGLLLEEGRRYRVRLRPQEDWIDGSIPAGPEGFPSNRMAWYARLLGTPLRRSLADPWFKPMVRIGARRGFEQPLDFKPAGEAGVVAAEFSARRSGELFMFVNDVVVGWEPDRYYKCAPGSETSCNRGTAEILVSPLR